MENILKERIENFKKVEAIFNSKNVDFFSLTVEEIKSARKLIGDISSQISFILRKESEKGGYNANRMSVLISNYNIVAEKIGYEKVKYSGIDLFITGREENDSDKIKAYNENRAQLLQAQEKLERYDSVLNNFINSNNKTTELHNSSKVENSGFQFFRKLGNAIVNFFTKTLPSIFINSKEEKNSAELQGINGDKKSTVAKTMEKLAGHKAQKLLEKPTPTDELEQTIKKEQ